MGDSSEEILSRAPMMKERVQEVMKERDSLYKTMYKFPPICNEIAWTFLLLISLAACFVAIVYGLSFDLMVEGEDNTENENYEFYESGCWNSSLQLRIENELSSDYFDGEYEEREEMNESSYAGSDTNSWILSLGQSLTLSLVLWQPLTLYVVTWIKIWLFTWNLPLKFPAKIPAAIKLCLCGRSSRETEKDMVAQIERVHDEGNVDNNDSGDDEAGNDGFTLPSFSRRTTVGSLIMANANRPNDLLSFFANDENLIDDTRFATDHGIVGGHSDNNNSSGGTIESKPTSSTDNNESGNDQDEEDDHEMTVSIQAEDVNRDLDVVLQSAEMMDHIEMSNVEDKGDGVVVHEEVLY